MIDVLEGATPAELEDAAEDLGAVLDACETGSVDITPMGARVLVACMELVESRLTEATDDVGRVGVGDGDLGKLRSR